LKDDNLRDEEHCPKCSHRIIEAFHDGCIVCSYLNFDIEYENLHRTILKVAIRGDMVIILKKKGAYSIRKIDRKTGHKYIYAARRRFLLSNGRDANPRCVNKDRIFPHSSRILEQIHKTLERTRC